MRSLRHLNKYFWKYRWRLILGILFAVLSTFFGIYVAVLVRKATDFMTHAFSEHYSFEVTAEELLKYFETNPDKVRGEFVVIVPV